jgi:AcrR family transcriptional regulator
MARPTRPYHHGKLREALIKAATEVVEKTGRDDVSLRAVARKAGVSHAAAYHHFADRNALIAAVAAHGLDALTARMQSGWHRSRLPARAFRAMGAAYVSFALERPALFRLMFGGETADRAAYPDRQRAAESTFGALVTAVEECQQEGIVRPGPPEDLALTAWASVHGIASLVLDQQLGFRGFNGRTPTALADAVLVGYFKGARAPRRRSVGTQAAGRQPLPPRRSSSARG